MPYTVRAHKVGEWPGRWRSGRFFPHSADTLLQDDEVTPAMREDPVLIIQHVPAEVELTPGAEIIGGEDLPELPALMGGEPYELGVVEGQPSEITPEMQELLDRAPAPPAAVNGAEAEDGPTKCTGTKEDGSPCKAWAQEGSDRCWRHPHAEEE